MTPERFQQIRNVFEAALEYSALNRTAFVADACQGDRDLQREVRRLLDAHDATVTVAEPSSPKPARTDLAAREGQILGDYEILRELGRGGMGAVYLARRADHAFQKNVAIKILHRDAASSEIVQRFRREREVLAQLDHPNIARLLDAGETEDGLPYFVMEYIEGRPLTQYCDDQMLPLRDRMELFQQVCDAVEYAHQRKIVHRDLKPGNVLVTTEGQVKLLDFGIARPLEQDAAVAGLTVSGMWLMTPEYASPEQVRGEVAGRASDIYSLGVMLFELLTGHRPYHLRNRIIHEVVRVVCEESPTRPSSVVTQPVDITTTAGKPATLPPETVGRLRRMTLDQLRDQLSGDLDNILLKALEKQPQNRYSSALQFRADIDRHLQGDPVWARSNSRVYQLCRRLSHYRIALVAIAVTLAAVASGTVSLRWSALLWVAGGISLIAVWHAATDFEISRKIAESRFAQWGLAILFAGLGLLAVFAPRSWGPWFLVVNVILALICCSLLAVWFFRKRWAGPLILRIGESDDVRKIVLVMNVGGLFTNGFQIIFPKLRSRQPLEVSDLAFLFWILAISAMLWLSTRQEIRRDGFIKLGRLIRWSRIAYWTWEADDLDRGPITLYLRRQQPKPILELHLYHAIKFLPNVRLRIDAWQKNDVEAVLVRQLGRWPAP